MTLFITSSPFEQDTDRPRFWEKNGFAERLRQALPELPRVTFVASDPERHDLCCRFGADAFCALTDAGIFPECYRVLDGETCEDAADIVYTSDQLIFSGGHVPTQNAFFQDIGLRELMERFDGVVVGISAGSMNCADCVYVQPEEEGESSPDFPRWAEGLGLTDVNILPHYQKVKDNILDGLRLFEDITYADSMENTFFALPDGSYFYQDDDGLLLCGEGYRLQDGILEQLTQNGDVLDMEELN